jgi:hypothetical protein
MPHRTGDAVRAASPLSRPLRTTCAQTAWSSPGIPPPPQAPAGRTGRQLDMAGYGPRMADRGVRNGIGAFALGALPGNASAVGAAATISPTSSCSASSANRTTPPGPRIDHSAGPQPAHGSCRPDRLLPLSIRYHDSTVPSPQVRAPD